METVWKLSRLNIFVGMYRLSTHQTCTNGLFVCQLGVKNNSGVKLRLVESDQLSSTFVFVSQANY